MHRDEIQLDDGALGTTSLFIPLHFFCALVYTTNTSTTADAFASAAAVAF